MVAENKYSWNEIQDWLGNQGITILLVCAGAFLATRVVTIAAKRRARRLAAARAETDTSTRAEVLGAHQEALVGAVRWGVNFCIVFTAIIWVLIELSLPASAFVPLVSVIGVGLGFGAQQIVGDVLTGVFILSERQFGVGDLVRVGPLISVGWVEGRVEEMSLRVTKVRTFDGDLVTIANGELRQSVNASRDWARVLVNVPLPRYVDLDAVTERLNHVGESLAEDPKWKPLMLEVPSVAGLDELGTENIEVRVVGRTLPAQQYIVARELRRRIALALRQMNVAVGESAMQPRPERTIAPDAEGN